MPPICLRHLKRTCLITTAAIALIPLTGSTTITPRLPDAIWCSTVRSALEEAGVGWPVANRRPTQDQIVEIDRIFTTYASRASGILEIAAKGWLQGFQAMADYLAAGDQLAFNQNVSDDLREQTHLANLELNNRCGWLEWK